jgi:hypothetical protein
LRKPDSTILKANFNRFAASLFCEYQKLGGTVANLQFVIFVLPVHNTIHIISAG